MKIGTDKSLSRANINANDTVGLTAGVKKPKAKGPRDEQVEISVRKAEVEKLKKLAAGLPEYRSDSLATLKQQISQGTYRVDASRIAEKMLQIL